MKFGVVNKSIILNRFVLHTLQRNITHSAVITRKTNKKLGILKGGGELEKSQNKTLSMHGATYGCTFCSYGRLQIKQFWYFFSGLLSCDMSPWMLALYGCYGIMHGATYGYLEKLLRDVWLTRNHIWYNSWASNNCSERPQRYW